jgi:hypothetical protein
MYLIVYTDKNANALYSDNSSEIPNTYKNQPFRMSLVIATSVPEWAWGMGHRENTELFTLYPLPNDF